MGAWEWPLILFTILGQTAIGLILALWWLDRHELDAKLFKRATLASGILLTLALITSLFHLGHPEAAYRALSHLTTSWLSREILFFLFTFLAWVYLFFQSRQETANRRLALAIASILGLLGIISSAMIYVLPRVPAWDNVGPILFFLLSTGLLGGTSMLALGSKALKPSQTKGLLQWALGCLVAGVLVFIIYISLLRTSPEGAATAQILLTSPLFWLRAITGWLAPLFYVLLLLKKNAFTANLLLGLALLAGLGELLGRALFYLSAVGIHISAWF